MGHRLEPLNPLAAGLADQIYERLGAAILDGRFAPGERLKDHDLAIALGVSRTPVREALQRLERIGLVEVAASRYTRVTMPTEEFVQQTVEYAAYQSGIAMRMALLRMDDGQLDELVTLLDDLISSSENGEDADEHEVIQRFFRAVTASSGNVAFQMMIREATPALERALRMVHTVISTREQRTDTQRRLRTAMVQRDVDEAERLVRVHQGMGVEPPFEISERVADSAIEA